MKLSGLRSRLHAALRLLVMTSLLGCSQGQEVSLEGKPAVDFTLRTIDGENIQLSAYRGKKVVHLIFWATWCPSCTSEVPKLKKLYQEAMNKPYEILAIDVGYNDSLQRVRQFQERYQLPYKIIFDESAGLALQYEVIGIPTHVIVNKEGVIVTTFNQLPENVEGYLAQFVPAASSS
jgi:peroxiredoxin